MDWLTGLKRESLNGHATEKKLDGVLIDKIIANPINVDQLKKQKTETTPNPLSKQETIKEKTPEEILETLLKGFEKNPGKAVRLLKALFETRPETFDHRNSIDVINKVFDNLSSLKQVEITEAVKSLLIPLFACAKKIDQSDSLEEPSAVS